MIPQAPSFYPPWVYDVRMSELEIVENEYTSPLTQKELRMRRGWNLDIARQLVTLSKEPHILFHTPNDTARRFPDCKKATEWHESHHRVIYTLANTAVSGLIWFGETSENPNGQFTFAIRMYQKSQGQRLAKPFMDAAHADFREVEQYDGPIWLDTDMNNASARALYEKTGYEEIGQEGNRIIMVQES